MALGAAAGTGGGAPSDAVRELSARVASCAARSSVFSKRSAGLLLETPRDDCLQSLRGVGAQASQRLGLALDHRGQDLGGRVAAEHGPPRAHLGEDEADRELVGAAVHGLAGGLFRGHVLERAEQHAGPGVVQRDRLRGVEAPDGRRHQLREAEVEDLQQAVSCDNEVLGLEIAVEDTGTVRVRQAVGQLRPEAQDLGDGQRAPREAAPQGLALDVLHHDVVLPSLAWRLANVVDLHDVRVAQRGGRARLAIEAAQQPGIRIRAQHLERHRAAETGVARAVDHAHPARPQAVDHLVGANARARSDRHGHHRDYSAAEGCTERPRDGRPRDAPDLCRAVRTRQHCPSRSSRVSGTRPTCRPVRPTRTVPRGRSRRRGPRPTAARSPPSALR